MRIHGLTAVDRLRPSADAVSHKIVVAQTDVLTWTAP
jgi:hypothetical protein